MHPKIIVHYFKR